MNGLVPRLRPGKRSVTPGTGSGFAFGCGQAVVVLLFVGVSAIGLSAPAPFLGLDLCDAWPGAVAGWWLMLARTMCLAFVWRVAVQTLVGFESACTLTAIAIGSLSLLLGAAGLWQRDALRSVVGRLLLIHSGLSWLIVAAMSAKPTGDATTITLGGVPVGVFLAVLLWAIGSIAVLVIFAIEQSLTAGRGRLEFVEEYSGLGHLRPLAAGCLSAGLLSLTLIPPGELTASASESADRIPNLFDGDRDTPAQGKNALAFAQWLIGSHQNVSTHRLVEPAPSAARLEALLALAAAVPPSLTSLLCGD